MSSKKKDKVIQRYDRWSRYYDALDTFPGVGRYEKRWRLEAIALLDLKGGETVLDAGTGSGLILPWIAEAMPSGKLVATDLSEGMLAKARERVASVMKEGVEIEIVKDDVESSSYPDDTFDRIISTFTLTSVPDLKMCVQELARILKKGGHLVVLDTGKPTSLVYKLYFPLMRGVAALSGYTYMGRDIIGLIEGCPNLKILEVHRFFGGMVYIVVAEKG